jgi:hypothetical protein
MEDLNEEPLKRSGTNHSGHGNPDKDSKKIIRGALTNKAIGIAKVRSFE